MSDDFYVDSSGNIRWKDGHATQSNIGIGVDPSSVQLVNNGQVGWSQSLPGFSPPSPPPSYNSFASPPPPPPPAPEPYRYGSLTSSPERDTSYTPSSSSRSTPKASPPAKPAAPFDKTDPIISAALASAARVTPLPILPASRLLSAAAAPKAESDRVKALRAHYAALAAKRTSTPAPVRKPTVRAHSLHGIHHYTRTPSRSPFERLVDACDDISSGISSTYDSFWMDRAYISPSMMHFMKTPKGMSREAYIKKRATTMRQQFEESLKFWSASAAAAAAGAIGALLLINAAVSALSSDSRPEPVRNSPVERPFEQR